MKTPPLFAFALAAAIGIPASVCGQEAGPVPEIRINKVDAQLVPVPDYGGAGNFRRSRDAAPWLQIEVEFDMKLQGATGASPRYVDELTFSYYVAFLPDNLDGGAQNPNAGKAFSLDITHVDVKTSTPGQSRYSVAYLPGRVLERLTGGKIPPVGAVNIAVEIKAKGATAPLAVRAEGPLRNTDGWWNQVDKVPGVLVPKEQSPFAPLAWDRHEPVKLSPGR